MTSVNELNQCPCEKYDPAAIDAYFELLLDPENPTRLVLEHSWGETSVDLTGAVKSSETITHLFLTPETNPSALQYNREDFEREGAQGNGIDCIEGDDLSRIISMRYLKDVDQLTGPRGGDVYMYNDVYNTFYTFNLQSYMDKTDGRLDELERRVGDFEADLDGARNLIEILNTRIKDLQKQVDNLQAEFNAYVTKTDARLTNIENTIAKPSWAPSDTRLVWGNIDVEYALTPTTKGLYGHNPATMVVGDMRFE